MEILFEFRALALVGLHPREVHVIRVRSSRLTAEHTPTSQLRSPLGSRKVVLLRANFAKGTDQDLGSRNGLGPSAADGYSRGIVVDAVLDVLSTCGIVVLLGRC